MNDRDDTPPLETDPRFPTGRWRGYYVQFGRRADMELNLEFRDGDVHGEGEDPVGWFIITGTYDVDDGKVLVQKEYLGRHTVIYDGVAGADRHLRGDWTFRHSQGRGPWHLWPIGDEADRAETTVVKQPIVISNWITLESEEITP